MPAAKHDKEGHEAAIIHPIFMRYSYLMLIFMSVVCFAPQSNAEPQERKGSVIYVGMSFDAAVAKLKQFGAAETGFDVILSPEATRAGKSLRWFYLRSGNYVSMVVSPLKTGGQIIDSINISTYKPKSIKYKLDPEETKLFQSFVSQQAIDLAEYPKQIPEPAPVITGSSN